MKDNKDIQKTYSYCYEDKFAMEDVENRLLFLNVEINDGIIDTAVYHILRYNRLDKDIPIENRKPIIILINSPGGSITSGYALIDAILTSKTPVYTVNLGTAYSMGFLIYIAGERRYSMPSATCLCHDGNTGVYDSMSKVRDRVEFETGQMEQHTQKYIISRTNITREQYLENYRKEWYFYPNESKLLGVTTHIIGVDCTLDDII